RKVVNSRNPQLPCLVFEPMIPLKRYHRHRQAKIRPALEQLKGLENLSGDLYEKIPKPRA
ncbi:aminopeptidase N C-terminal domain-containing protein, partial [Enterobacter hormaechei]